MGKYRKKPVVIEAFQLNARGLVGSEIFHVSYEAVL